MKLTKIAIVVLIALTAVIAHGQKETTSMDDLPEMGEFKFDGDLVVLPLTAKSGHPKVLVDLGEGGTLPFIVDTGASVNVIDSAIAEKMAFEVVGETEIGVPGGVQIPGKIIRIPEVHVGDAAILNAEFVVMDINGFSMGTMQGVLGLRLFEQYLLSFDLSGGTISVAKGRLSADSAGAIPYKVVGDKINLDVDVAGITVLSHIDTGSMGEFMFPIEIMELLPLKTAPQTGAQAKLVGGARDITFAQLDGDINFAGMQFVNPNLTFMDPAPGAGNIGSGIFGDYVMTIDQKNHLISFTKPEGRPAVTQSHKPRRLGLGFRGVPGGSSWVVSVVSTGSLASNAGIMAGDELVSLNGVDVAEYDMAKFGELLQSSTPLEFVFEREGTPYNTEIE